MKSCSLVIINYHLVSDKIVGESLYCINTFAFREQLKLIKNLNIPVIDLNNFTITNDSDFYAALTFDDGYETHYTKVVPLLEHFNFPATFFPIVDFVGKPNRLTWEQLKKISDKGFSIGSHGFSHNIMTKMTLQELEKELNQSKVIIEEKILKQINYFAFPYGWHNKTTVELAKKYGYKNLLVTGLKINNLSKHPYTLSRWNITNNTSLELFKNILLSKGQLPLKLMLLARLKQIVKHLLGHRLAERINRILNYG